MVLVKYKKLKESEAIFFTVDLFLFEKLSDVSVDFSTFVCWLIPFSSLKSIDIFDWTLVRLFLFELFEELIKLLNLISEMFDVILEEYSFSLKVSSSLEVAESIQEVIFSSKVVLPKGSIFVIELLD
jgi:hypothetical protein